MTTSRSARFLQTFDRLTPSKMAVVIAHLASREAIDTISAGSPHTCPTCAGTRSHRWGTIGVGVQRHRCSMCGTTSTARSGTPLARVHRPDLLLVLITDMVALRDVSCRAAARRLWVDHTTAWRWRRLILESMPNPSPETLVGVVEMDEACQRESSKGSREWAKHAAGAAPQPPRLPWAKTKRKPKGLGRWMIPLLGIAQRSGVADLVLLARARHTDIADAVS